jgi:malate dehydrogenase (oxaloacetate-decarboxylating)
MRSSASWPWAVMARVLARASLGSAVRWTYPLSSSAVTSRVSVDGAMPSAAARSPSRIGPVFPIVDSAASWVGVRPASSCRRSRRDSRARATRSRVTSTSGASVSPRPLTTGSVLTLSAYAVRPVRLEAMSMAPSVSYSITVRLEVASRGRAVSAITRAVEQTGGVVTALDVTAGRNDRLRVDVTCAARGEDHAQSIVQALAAIDGVTVHKVSDRTFLLHLGGKIEMRSKVPLRNRDDLSMAYTPGVGRVALAIAANPDDARRLTIKRNSVAVVTDGSAVLGLGNIGPYAALPVMEGKAALFKRFADIDAWPICLDSQDSDEIVRAVQLIAPGFGGINLEDISAPRCFEVERRLRELLDIPVFHDDQHGTAIVVMAALTNALRVVGKKLPEVRIAMAGAGAAGTAVLKLLLQTGAANVIVTDDQGAVHENRPGLNPSLRWIAEHTNRDGYAGDLRSALKGADVFIGLSAPHILTGEGVKTMAANSIVFALANPDPEVDPDAASEYAAVVATGRSDYPNQINNVLAFPGVFRGLLDAQSRHISDDMLIAAAQALADVVSPDEIGPHYIIPSVFHPDVTSSVAAAVRDAATSDTALSDTASAEVDR